LGVNGYVGKDAFVGEDEIVDVQGYNIATPDIRTDPFDVVDGKIP
jgi:hypothetical protein